MCGFCVLARPATVIVVALFLIAAFPPAVALAESALPESVKALPPNGVTLGESSWNAMETEFGFTFGGHLGAGEFQGQKPSCANGPKTEFRIDLQGDTAFDQPPMLDIATLTR